MLKITIVTMGDKMPNWVNHAVSEYTKRLQDHITLTIIEIPLIRRGKSTNLTRILEKEMTMMSNAIPHNSYLIALEINGESFSSEHLAARIAQMQQYTSHLCFVIGGPEGLSSELLVRCKERWSLSKLTLPHTLVRIILLETIYRSWSILHHHPYHK